MTDRDGSNWRSAKNNGGTRSETMNKSESIKELASALAKAQSEIEKAEKDKTNPHFRSKYADLGNVVDAIKPAIASHGLSFVQVSHDSDNCAKVETVILHQSGEWLSCGTVSVPVSKADAQGFGSALTYARRYSLAAAFGVAPDDDDGNAAAKNPPKKPQEPSVAELQAMMQGAGSIEDLQAAFAPAWKKYKGTAHETAIKAVYDKRKHELEAA